MAQTDALRPYQPAAPTQLGEDRRYLRNELDKLSTSISSVRDVMQGLEDSIRSPALVSVVDYGAKGDVVSVSATVSITAGAASLTATGATFTAADVGKIISIPGAGAAGAELIATIITFTNSTHVVVNVNASTTLSAATKTIVYGTDNTAFFNTALAATTSVYVPAGNYAFNATVQVFKAGNVLVGSGPNATILTSMSKVQPLVQFGPSQQNVGIRDMTITRAVVATGATAMGIYQNNTVDAGYINNVEVFKHYVGISLSTTGYSRLMNSTIASNVSHGIQFIRSDDGGATTYQWNLDNVLVGSNGGDGIQVNASGSTSGGCSMGNWMHISSFGNGGPALRALGINTAPISNLRVTGAFFGGDGIAEIVLDTYNDIVHPHSFTDVQLELGAAGYFITSNNGPISITNPWIEGMTGSGITSDGTMLSVTGGYIFGCSAQGISVGAASSRLRVSNCGISQNAGYGIAFTTGSGPHMVTNCDFTYGVANTAGAFFNTAGIAAGSTVTPNIT